MQVKKLFTLLLYITGTLVFIAAALSDAHCQAPDPQKAVMEGMLRACQSLADEVEAGRKLIKAQADEIRAGQDALKSAQAVSAEKDAKLKLQEQALTQKQVTLDETDKALTAQKGATDAAVGALNAERAKSRLYKKLAAGAVIIAIAAVYIAGH